MRYVGMVFGVVFAVPYVALFIVIRIGDLWASGNLRDAIAVPCNKAVCET